MKVTELTTELHGLNIQDVIESLSIPVQLHSGRNISLMTDIDEIPYNLMVEFASRLCDKLDHEPSKIYRLATGTMSYRTVPPAIRSRLMRMKVTKTEIYLGNKIDLEMIRKRFLEALSIGESSADICILTHDIDSEKGMKRALRFKEIEEKYDVESTWFIPVEEYKLDIHIVKRLAERGEVASHSTRHNGKLISSKIETIVKDLVKSKQKLEAIVEREIYGFRAPLLQYNMKLLKAVGEAGYKFDSSMPTWEPMHPITMKPDGIGLLNPIKVNGVLEVPVTLPQDHQMIHVLGFTPEQTVKRWIGLMTDIKKLGGISVLLIHPDYEFANGENLELYENLIKSISVKKLVSYHELLVMERILCSKLQNTII